MEPRKQLINLGGISLDQHLHGPVGAVSHPTAYLQSNSPFPGVRTKGHPLHSTMHPGTHTFPVGHTHLLTTGLVGNRSRIINGLFTSPSLLAKRCFHPDPRPYADRSLDAVDASPCNISHSRWRLPNKGKELHLIDDLQAHFLRFLLFTACFLPDNHISHPVTHAR